MRILVGVCSGRDWKPQFGVHFALAICTARHQGHEIGLESIDIKAGVAQSNIAQARQDIVKYALDNGHTHIMMFDDDMTFPPDVILQLAKHKKQVVFPNVCRKLPNQVSGVVLDDNLERLNSTGLSGLQKVPYGTLACTLIEVSALKDLQEPHFEVLWNPKKYPDGSVDRTVPDNASGLVVI